MKLNSGIFLIVLAFGVIALGQSMYTVDQREQAIVLHLGQPVGEVKQPGLHFKVPLIEEVRRFDRRILAVDPPPEQMVISASRENAIFRRTLPAGAIKTPAQAAVKTDDVASAEPIIVDTYARYRISDPLKFLKSMRGDIGIANQRIQGIVNDATRAALGKSTLQGLLSSRRSEIMREITTSVNKQIEGGNLGIQIVDIRIVRADLTPDLRQSTVRRMISELKERATETRAEGEEIALEIRSGAEKERTVILANAQSEAQTLRGQGDNEAIQIYAKTLGQDKEFYSFIRSLEAYRNTLASPDTRLLLSPDGAFFKYFKGGE